MPKSDGVNTPASSLQSSFSDPSLNGIEKNVMNVSTSSIASDSSTVSEKGSIVYGSGMESLSNFENQQNKVNEASMNFDAENSDRSTNKLSNGNAVNNAIKLNGNSDNSKPLSKDENFKSELNLHPSNGTAENGESANTNNGTNDQGIIKADHTMINGSQKV